MCYRLKYTSPLSSPSGEEVLNLEELNINEEATAFLSAVSFS